MTTGHEPDMGLTAVDGPPRPRVRPYGGVILRWLGFAGIVALFAAAAYLAGFVLFASHVAGLKTPASLPAADAIVVLTGGQSRLEAAVELLRSGKGKRLLISGVHPAARRPALQRATGAEASLFACCVDIDRAALDTTGNAVESAKWLTKNGFSSIIVVTNNYHMPRSLLEMSRTTEGIELIAYPVVNADLGHGGWLTKPAALRVLFTEYGKFAMALLRGS
ncbi:MAG: YdcF family protein [Rhizobiaceae bacterium]